MTQAAERAADSKSFERAARMGYVASGLLHALIGLIALQIAFGDGGSADSSGAMSALASRPGGIFLIWACFLGCLALALFQVSRAFLDSAGSRKEVWKKRATDAGSAVVYGAIGISFGVFALGGSSDSGQNQATWTARLLSQPAGQILVGLIGAVVAGIGIYFVYKGVMRTFRKNLGPIPSGPWQRAVTITGITGFTAKGLSLLILGGLVIAAAATADPQKSTGLDGALHALKEAPQGWLALGAVGVGLICYGLYLGIMRARFGKL
ncbi:DUF1206 domain-containing protein [Arthrobacter sp. Sa2CUA1]|uniref:DUF1206 domain-containing protein n=2 Tax=Arthrobacter TaxID=1663 RepID=A0ABR8URA0_9MICC|nr:MULTISPECIES: DUF1206 domain-containing protein [Arthrobacter]MBD7995058.1 DUF1206 domain-containing protein [Arthrobacter gallicola]MBD8042210.1 DUF1206 domain-containing protein [Arthrobacter pullicola]